MRMDGESGLASGRIQRERKRSYKDFMQDLDDTELGVEEEEEDQEYNTNRHKEPKKNRKHSGNDIADPEECAVFLPACPNYEPQDGWRHGEGKGEVEDEEKEIGSQDKLLHAVCTVEGSIEQVNEGSLPQYWEYPDDQDGVAESHMKSPVGSIASQVNHLEYPILSLSNSVTPIADPLKYPDSALMSNIGSPASSLCCPTTSASDSSPTAGAWAPPECVDLGPANVAAHLHLLGESLSLIGQHLQETNKLVWVSGGLSLLLDSLLCSLAPLTCLTLQIPELRSCSQHTMADTLDNIAYVMPGL